MRVASIALARIFASPRRSIAGGLNEEEEATGTLSDCLCHSNAIARTPEFITFSCVARHATLLTRENSAARIEPLDKPIKNNVTRARYLTPASQTPRWTCAPLIPARGVRSIGFDVPFCHCIVILSRPSVKREFRAARVDG